VFTTIFYFYFLKKTQQQQHTRCKASCLSNKLSLFHISENSIGELPRMDLIALTWTQEEEQEEGTSLNTNSKME
jgi:hypothetical protein